jgi:hypothetical protein
MYTDEIIEITQAFVERLYFKKRYSSLTSYWGYAYLGSAKKGRFSWNETDFYTQQSPVFLLKKSSHQYC